AADDATAATLRAVDDPAVARINAVTVAMMARSRGPDRPGVVVRMTGKDARPRPGDTRLTRTTHAIGVLSRRARSRGSTRPIDSADRQALPDVGVDVRGQGRPQRAIGCRRDDEVQRGEDAEEHRDAHVFG